ncbi:hypothetical protein KIPB_002396 [Kipferlia bialata]|uniref:Uncharacterized protein n=1 Tax=Kipferlia bialata TaxID=797122 RepID=A0A9K3CQF5_9EUKA|nr:hypothetical protein KIPB_002396 [Kipferlia bialata]|eukprot:g2396.t1
MAKYALGPKAEVEVTLTGTSYVRTGGDALTRVIADTLLADALGQYEASGMGPMSDRQRVRMESRILAAAEKAKQVLSVNTDTRVLVDSLVGDWDFRAKETYTRSIVEAAVLGAAFKGALSKASLRFATRFIVTDATVEAETEGEGERESGVTEEEAVAVRNWISLQRSTADMYRSFQAALVGLEDMRYVALDIVYADKGGSGQAARILGALSPKDIASIEAIVSEAAAVVDEYIYDDPCEKADLLNCLETRSAVVDSLLSGLQSPIDSARHRLREAEAMPAVAAALSKQMSDLESKIEAAEKLVAAPLSADMCTQAYEGYAELMRDKAMAEYEASVTVQTEEETEGEGEGETEGEEMVVVAGAESEGEEEEIVEEEEVVEEEPKEAKETKKEPKKSWWSRFTSRSSSDDTEGEVVERPSEDVTDYLNGIPLYKRCVTLVEAYDRLALASANGAKRLASAVEKVSAASEDDAVREDWEGHTMSTEEVAALTKSLKRDTTRVSGLTKAYATDLTEYRKRVDAFNAKHNPTEEEGEGEGEMVEGEGEVVVVDVEGTEGETEGERETVIEEQEEVVVEPMEDIHTDILEDL